MSFEFATDQVLPLSPFIIIPQISHIATVRSRSAAGAARCVKLSSDGMYMAIASDSGVLEVLQFGPDGSWKRIGMFSAGSAIRALVWHPSKIRSVLIGAANGVVYEITLGLHHTANVINYERLYGFIHLLVFSADGQTLIIAHGNIISVVRHPFLHRNKLGPTTTLAYPHASEVVKSLRDYGVPRGIFFLPDGDTVVVAFFGTKGIRAYSLVTSDTVWTIPLRKYSFLGSCAISPSGERIAVMNLRDGIDFYSVANRQYISTTKYTLSSKQTSRLIQLVDIVFLDEDVVAFGHSDGYTGISRFGVDGISATFRVEGVNSEIAGSPIQSICSGRTPYGLSLVAISADSQLVAVGHFQNHTSLVTTSETSPQQTENNPMTHRNLKISGNKVSTAMQDYYQLYRRIWDIAFVAALSLMVALIIPHLQLMLW